MLENDDRGRKSRGFNVVVFCTCAWTHGAATIAAPSETKAAIRMTNSPDLQTCNARSGHKVHRRAEREIGL
jgi:hypothetical protein